MKPIKESHQKEVHKFKIVIHCQVIKIIVLIQKEILMIYQHLLCNLIKVYKFKNKSKNLNKQIYNYNL